MNPKRTYKIGTEVKKRVTGNIVMLLFITICAIGIYFAAQPSSYIASEIAIRLFRNLILILSLIIPVWAGMGLNFSIVLGAMAAQAGLIVIMNFDMKGIAGLVIAFAISVPLAAGLGILTGKLFNKTKGQEMITGMILGYFAKGVYELIFMYLCGPVIPMDNPQIMLESGVGINGIITMDASLNGAVDKIWKLPLDKLLWIIFGVLTAFLVLRLVYGGVKRKQADKKCLLLLGIDLLLFIIFVYAIKSLLSFQILCMMTQVPMVTCFLVMIICGFIVFLGRTKLGSDIKAVGQSIPIAQAAGIAVNKIRIIAVVISTVIAALGQIIYLQNLGTFTTYSAHEQIGTFSIAALLVGGASIKKAGIGHAILGGVLFHLMFIVAPIAGKNIFNDAQIGEYFRVFASYAVIALALVLHAWRIHVEEKRKTGALVQIGKEAEVK
ncbi:MAG: ABC transporter permease [Lachnospiraceae bacterium]